MILMSLVDSSTDRVSDSRASSGLWKPSAFPAVQYPQEVVCFQATTLSMRAADQHSAFRILPLQKALIALMKSYASSAVHFR